MMADFSHIEDPELREALERAAKEHEEKKRADEAMPDVEGPPKYVFARSGPSSRKEGAMVRVRNALDEEPRGGTIVRKIGRAYLVNLGDKEIVVHEADDSW